MPVQWTLIVHEALLELDPQCTLSLVREALLELDPQCHTCKHASTVDKLAKVVALRTLSSTCSVMEGCASHLIGCNYFDDGLEFIESRTYTWLDERIFKDNVSRGIPCIKGLAHTCQVQLRDSAGLWIRMWMFHMPS